MVTKASTKRPGVAAKGESRREREARLTDEREARLAKALRENLKRRKEQARVRKGAGNQGVDN